MGARVESVNVGVVRDVPWGTLKRSAIDKRPVDGPVRVHAFGVESDEIADLEHHGGRDQAVYAYAAEDLEEWSRTLGREIGPGEFGENLTTRGLDVQHARLGDRWQVGGALLEVSGVRIPCSVFQGFLGERQWVRRFTERGVPGAYLRVVSEGALAAGDAVEVVERRAHELTVALAFRAATTRRDLLAGVLEEPRTGGVLRRRAEAAAQTRRS